MAVLNSGDTILYMSSGGESSTGSNLQGNSGTPNGSSNGGNPGGLPGGNNQGFGDYSTNRRIIPEEGS